MTENAQEGHKCLAGANGQGEGQGRERTKRPAPTVSFPPIFFEKTHTTAITVPEIKPLGQDRRSRREAQEAHRELARIAIKAIKHRANTQTSGNERRMRKAGHRAERRSLPGCQVLGDPRDSVRRAYGHPVRSRREHRQCR